MRSPRATASFSFANAFFITSMSFSALCFDDVRAML
jgi:hypothetical protein